MAFLIDRKVWRRNPTRGGLTVNPEWASVNYAWHAKNSIVPGQYAVKDSEALVGSGLYGDYVESVPNGTFDGFGPLLQGNLPLITSGGGWSVLCVYQHISVAGVSGGLVRTTIQNGLGINGSGMPAIYSGSSALHTSSIAAPTTRPSVIIARMLPFGPGDEIYVDGVLGVSGFNPGYNYTGTLFRLGSGYGQGRAIGRFYLAASFPRYLSLPDIKALSENPWQIFAPVADPVFYSSGGSAVPTLSNPTAIDITASSFRPRVSYQY